MKKRLIAIMLIITMVMSLIACGKAKSNEPKKAPSLSGAAEEACKITKGISEIELNLVLEGILEESLDQQYADIFNKISIKSTSVVESISPLKESVELYYKFGSQTEYKKLTTLIVNDKEFYINLNEVKTAITDIATLVGQSQLLIALGFLPTQEYLKVTEDEIASYMESMGGMAVGTGLTGSMDPASTQAGVIIMKHLCKYVEDITKDLKPAVITGEENNVTLTITKDSFQPLLDAMSKTDITTYYDNLVKDLQAVSGTEELVTMLNESKDSFVTEFKTGITDTQTSLKDSDELKEFNAVFNIANSGKEGKRETKQTLSLLLAADDGTINGKIDMKFSSSLKEEIPSDKAVTIPTDCISFTDFVTAITSMLGQ